MNMIKDCINKACCELENELFHHVMEKTPDRIKQLNLIDLSNKDEFIFTLKREHLREYDEKENPQGLNLWAWFENYEKEAKVSTAGIRGPQNILFPQDTRFPINLIGITLATVAKALLTCSSLVYTIEATKRKRSQNTSLSSQAEKPFLLLSSTNRTVRKKTSVLPL